MKVGKIEWIDICVPDATNLRDFYSDVVGWEAEAVEMEGYSDYAMKNPNEDDPVCGICHARWINEKLPPVWLPYITVDNLSATLEKALARGAKIIDGPRDMGHSAFACIQDPAGAYVGLYQASRS